MIKRNWVAIMVTGVVMTVMLLPQPVAAQNHWLRPADKSSVSLDVFKAKWDGGDFNFLTTVVFVSAYIEASDNIAVVLEFPVSNVDTDGFNETLFGNPYLGLEARTAGLDASQGAVGRLGIRPPIASDEKWSASLLGLYSMIDRFEAFIPDVVTISAGGGYFSVPGRDMKLAFDLNGNLMVPTEDGDPELYIDYNLTFWALPPNAKLGFGFAGRLLATESDYDFGERTIHQLGLFGGYDFGTVESGIHFRVPIDEDISDVINFTFGVNVTVGLK